jgi:hypothetical protein
MRETRSGFNNLLTVEHDITDDATTGGFHGTNVTGKVDTSISTPPSGYGRFGWKTISGKAELFYKDDAGNETQITSAGKINLASITAIINDTYLTSVDNAGTGTVDLIKANTSDQVAFGAQIATFAMAAAKITNLANATASGDAIHLGQYSPIAQTGGNDSSGTRTAPDGTIEKWGSISASANTNTTNSFGVAFPNACFLVVGSWADDNTSDWYAPKLHSFTASSFKIRNTNGTEITARWRAIGR